MATALKSKPGLSGATALSIPKDWDATWFRNFINNMLKGADVRNAVGTGGIKVSGNIASPYATIDGSSIVGGITSVVGTANEIAVSTVGTVATISFANNIIIPAPPSGDSLTVNSVSGGNAIVLSQAGSHGTGGILQEATGVPTLVMNSPGVNFGQIGSNGTQTWFLGYGTSPTANGTAALTWNATGNVTINVPSSGNSLYIPATATTNAITIDVATGTNGGIELLQNGVFQWEMITGYPVAGDYTIYGGSPTTNHFTIKQNGGVVIDSATGGSQGAGTINAATGLYVAGVNIHNSGTFTGTLTGMTGATTGTITYVTDGLTCTLYAKAAIVGTSNSTTMTMTGLPAACQPAANVFGMSVNYENNSAIDLVGGVSVSGSTVSFYTMTANQLIGTGFTASGGKGLAAGWTCTYPLI